MQAANHHKRLFEGHFAAIQAELARVLFSSLPSTLFGGTALAAMLATILYGITPRPVLYGWLVLILVLAAVRGLMIAWFRRDGSRRANARRTLLLFRTVVGFSGIVWGICGLLLFPPHDVLRQTLLAFVLAGLSAGATTAYAIDMSCIILFLLPANLPFLARLAIEATHASVFMGIGTTLFLGYMLSTTRPAYMRFREIVYLRVEADMREKELKASEERFRQMFERHVSAMLLVDPSSGTIVDANPAASRFYGYKIQQLRGKNLQEIVAKEEDGPAVTHRLANGENRTVEVHSSTVEVAGRTHRFSIVHDVTDRVDAERSLRLHDAALNASANAIVITDKDGRVLWANQAFADLTGYRLEEAIGRALKEMKESGAQEGSPFEELWRTVLSGRPWRGELVSQRKNGVRYQEEITITPVRDEWQEIRHFVAVMQDITERKTIEAQIHDLAFHDTLTGLVNRRLLLERLEHALIAGRRSRFYGALMFMDLDNFKSLNDTLGHDVGDLLLVEVANRLKRSVRAEDTVARLGGDEFVVMIERLNEDRSTSTMNAGMVAEKLVAALADPYPLKRPRPDGGVDEVMHRCTASIGVAIFNHESTGEDVLKQADTAMYRSKTAGRNRISFFDNAER
jgi:diguanylate cyclase (GGDEF)-like protein/PAS domain S-box-containing protein